MTMTLQFGAHAKSTVAWMHLLLSHHIRPPYKQFQSKMARVNNPFKEKKSLQWNLLLVLALALGALVYIAVWRQPTEEQAPVLLRTTPREKESIYHQGVYQENADESEEEEKMMMMMTIPSRKKKKTSFPKRVSTNILPFFTSTTNHESLKSTPTTTPNSIATFCWNLSTRVVPI